MARALLKYRSMVSTLFGNVMTEELPAMAAAATQCAKTRLCSSFFAPLRRACRRADRRCRTVGILTAWRIALLLIASANVLPALAQSAAANAVGAESPLDAATRVAVALVRAMPIPAGARLEVEALPFDGRIHVAACALPLRAELIGHQLSGSRASVRVRCVDADNGLSISVALKVALFRHVLVARSPLTRGDFIDASTVDVAERDVLQAGYGYLENLESIVGARVLRPVREGALLVPGAIAARLLVEREGLVTLIVRGADVDVRAAGTALDDGSAHMSVRVRNASSGRILKGIVESAGVVAIGP